MRGTVSDLRERVSAAPYRVACKNIDAAVVIEKHQPFVDRLSYRLTRNAVAASVGRSRHPARSFPFHL